MQNKELNVIRDRIRELNKEIEKECEFIEFAASNDLHYKMADIHIQALKTERNKLQELLPE